MNPIDPPLPGPWHLAARAAAMNPSAIREISRGESVTRSASCRARASS